MASTMKQRILLAKTVLLMECGALGEHGQYAQKRVGLDLKIDIGHVPHRLQTMGEMNVKEKVSITRPCFYVMLILNFDYKVNPQIHVTIQHANVNLVPGVHGQIAVNQAVLVLVLVLVGEHCQQKVKEHEKF